MEWQYCVRIPALPAEATAPFAPAPTVEAGDNVEFENIDGANRDLEIISAKRRMLEGADGHPTAADVSRALIRQHAVISQHAAALFPQVDMPLWARNMEARLNQRLGTVSENLEAVRQEQIAQHNRLAAAHNASAAEQEGFEPFQSAVRGEHFGQVSDAFPRCRAACAELSAATINALAAFYGAPLQGGSVGERRLKVLVWATRSR